MIATGRIVDERDDGFTVFVPCVNHKKEMREALEKERTVYVEVTDPRMVSPAQRRKAHVLLGYIADWYGGTPLETLKVLTKEMFRGQSYSVVEDTFSLANCTMETARLYITWLIDFCVLHGIYTGSDPLYELAEDIPRYVWACALNKKCCVCGKKAEIHHVDRVGMGRDRHTINHIGMRCLPLCRKCHTLAHEISDEEFMSRYLLVPIRIDQRIVEFYHLNRKKRKTQ